MNQTIKLDTRKREGKYGEARIAPLRRGERNNALLTVKICANGVPYDLAGKTASLVATTAAGKLVGPCPMEVAEAGIARITLPAALYSAVGAFSGYVEIREGETLVDTTDSFGGMVIECADLDSEQAAEFTPLLGELQNAVAEEAKRVEAEKARVRAETERATGFAEAKQASQAATEAANDAAEGAKSAADSASDAAKSANTAAGKATNAAVKAESDVRAFVNAAGTAVGDAIAAAREDVDAAVKRSDAATAKAEAAVETADSANTAATKAVTDARDAIADVKATEAKLYPAAENILVGSEAGAIAHVEDAFAGATLRKIVVEGACKQDVTTGKNLVDAYNKENENGYLTVDGVLKYDSSYEYRVSDYVPIEPNTTYFITMSRTTNTSAPAVCEYDSGKAFVAGHNRLLKGAAFTTASNAAFVRVSCKTNEPDVIQLEKGSTQTAYEPYSGGKPSPSPEWPQQITVVENPIVKVASRNLWPFASSYTSIEGHQNEFVKEGTPFALLPGAYTFSAVGSLGNTDAPLFGYTATGKRFQFFRIMRNVTNPKYSFTVTEPITSVYFVSNAADSNTGTISSIQLERNSTATEYKPHTSQSLAFTLPAEHPYLAKLPDGTADTIEVDEEGNVELVARVARIKVPEGTTWNIQEQRGGFSLGYVGQILDLGDIKKQLDATALMCDRFRGKRSWENAPCFGVSEVLWVVPRTNQSDITSEDVAAVANGMVFYAPLATSVTYPIGKIEMPKAQDSIVNVWTDAEVTPNTGIRYVRDVNIVVANLESAIASITEG